MMVVVSRLSRIIQILLATLVSLTWLLDISCLLHPDGGLPAADVRRWYHSQLEKNIPPPPEKSLYYSTSRSKEDGQNGVPDNYTPNEVPIVLENGVATKAAEVESEFDRNVCETARIAVTARREARYAARKRGTLLHRGVLAVRDLLKYQGGVEFDFAQMLQKQKCPAASKEMAMEKEKSGDNPGVGGSATCSKKSRCALLYQRAVRTNEYYNQVLELAPHGKDSIFNQFEGYTAFIVEATVHYLGLIIGLICCARTVDFFVARRTRKKAQAEKKEQ
ncbi:unnamed protein product [Amoebophrya sp. A120]|nr:unnamed protein product [Amoebophrya sp. A120]|eukprot:GSA120T00001649001.1